ELVRRGLLRLREYSEVRGGDARRDIGFSGLKPHRLRVVVGHEHEEQTIEVRQSIAGTIRLPVVRVPFEDDPLAGYILLEPKRTEPRHLGRRGRQTPRSGEPAVGVSLLEKVTRQHRDAIE